MERGGFIGLDRNIRKHPMWPTNRAFSELEAWIYVLLFARWKDGWVEYQGARQLVPRGELLTSLHQLSRDWKWDRKRVRRTLDRWSERGQIEVRKRDRRGHQIKVMNYESYNPDGTKDGTKKGPKGGPKRDHERTNTTKKPSTTTTDTRACGWPCEQCEAGPFPCFDEYLEHVQDEHPEVFGDAAVVEESPAEVPA